MWNETTANNQTCFHPGILNPLMGRMDPKTQGGGRPNATSKARHRSIYHRVVLLCSLALSSEQQRFAEVASKKLFLVSLLYFTATHATPSARTSSNSRRTSVAWRTIHALWVLWRHKRCCLLGYVCCHCCARLRHKRNVVRSELVGGPGMVLRMNQIERKSIIPTVGRTMQLSPLPSDISWGGLLHKLYHPTCI